MFKYLTTIGVFCIVVVGCRDDYTTYQAIEGVSQLHIDKEIYPTNVYFQEYAAYAPSSEGDTAFVYLGAIRHRGKWPTDGTPIYATWLIIPTKTATGGDSYDVYRYRVWNGNDQSIVNVRPTAHRLESPLRVTVVKTEGHYGQRLWTVTIDGSVNEHFGYLDGTNVYYVVEHH